WRSPPPWTVVVHMFSTACVPAGRGARWCPPACALGSSWRTTDHHRRLRRPVASGPPDGPTDRHANSLVHRKTTAVHTLGRFIGYSPPSTCQAVVVLESFAMSACRRRSADRAATASGRGGSGGLIALGAGLPGR